MANRQYTPIMFALEKNVVHLGLHITFGASGAPTIDAPNSKGLCSIVQATQSFTATASTTASYTAVSTLKGLYNGMIISGTNVAAGSVISALNAAGTFTSSIASTGVVSAVTATGGYTLQFGTQAATRLDTYTKLLGFKILNDVSGLQGGAGVLASQTTAPAWHLTANNISKSGLASLTFICGTGSGTSFVASQPTSGEGIYMQLMLGNSTAP